MSSRTPRSAIVRTFHAYVDAHDYYWQLQSVADVVNLYGPQGELLAHWEREEAL